MKIEKKNKKVIIDFEGSELKLKGRDMLFIKNFKDDDIKLYINNLNLKSNLKPDYKDVIKLLSLLIINIEVNKQLGFQLRKFLKWRK